MTWIIVERDGVINHDADGCVTNLQAWQPYPGSLEGLALLARNGYKVALVSNQSGIGRGVLREEDLQSIHQKIIDEVALMGGELQGIYYCPHVPEENCDCRKPRTGMFDRIEEEFSISLQGAYCVGDSLKDIQVARAKGCKPILVRTGNGTQTETTTLLWPKYGEDIQIFEDFAAFAESLLRAG